MKKLALVLLILALLTAGVTVWGFVHARMDLEVGNVRALPDNEFLPRFERLREQLRIQAVRGIVYEDAPLGEPDDYVILEYTIKVGNRGFITAQMLEAVVVPLKGDVLCYSMQEAQGMDVNSSIEAGAGRQIYLRCYLLTRKDLHAVRDIQVSYYIWGKPFILKVKYG